MSKNRNYGDRKTAPSATLTALESRAALLRKLRDFFHQRGFVEVETPLLASEIIPELHIEPIWVDTTEGSSEAGLQPLRFWLQASPELHMKRLVAAGAHAIFQVTHSFRAGERGRLHNPEFTIVEWYRRDDDMLAGIGLLDELMQCALGASPAVPTSYAEAFQRHFHLDPHTAASEELAAVAESCGVALPAGSDCADPDEWLNLLLTMRIEPSLGSHRPEIIYHYPASQASLAKVVPSQFGYHVAERFELYYRGIELANGFHELTDAAEQRRRFEAVNAARMADGRPALPLPERLLAALEHGLPNCTGCALGFDRLAMLAMGAKSINDVLAFPVGPPY